MHFPSAPRTFVESGPGWVPGHSGTSSEAGPHLGFSLLLGSGPIWLGRTDTGTGSTLHCLSPVPLGSPVAWLQERSPVIAPVIPWLMMVGEIQTLGVQIRTQRKNLVLLWKLGRRRGVTKSHRFKSWLSSALATLSFDKTCATISSIGVVKST